MNNEFLKPYGGTTPVYFPYTREQLCQRPIFPTMVMDGGAFFFANDYLGDFNGDTLLEKTMSGEIFSYWMRDGKLDFHCVYKDFMARPYAPEYEGHIWINRLYILLPLAQAYCRTGESKYAEKWLEILKEWANQCPYTDYSDRPNDLIWRDMQVTWRCISLVFSLFLLGECPVFAREDWEFILSQVRLHADEMIREGKRYAQITEPDNHRLQIAMVLTMFATLYPEYFNAADLIATAKTIIAVNKNTSIFADGCNNEDSISYSHFNARLYLEAALFLKYNGYEMYEGADETIQRQYEFLYRFASPAGQTVQFGDGYVFDAFADVKFVDHVYPLTFLRQRGTLLFESSRMAVLANDRFSLYVDAMDMTEWHQHYGRPHFVLFCDGLPLIVDSGSVNYDRGGIRHMLNGPAGHNVIYAPEIPLTRRPSNESLTVEDFSVTDEEQTLTIRNRVTGENKHYEWVRTFILHENDLTVKDQVTASEPMNFVSLLHLPDCRTGYYVPSGERCPEQPNEARLRFGSLMETVTVDTPFETTYFPAVDGSNHLNYAQVMKRTFLTDHFETTTVIRLEKIR